MVHSLLILLIILSVGCSKPEADPNASGNLNARSAGSTPNMAAGAIRGRVIFEGAAPGAQRLMVVKDTEVCGRTEQYDKRLIVSKNQGIQNAVVYLTGVQGGKPLSSLGNEFILDQQGCSYEPHVLLVPVNTPLQILNNDGILHNFHTFSKKNRPVNMSQPEFREKMEMTFKHPEFIQARCDVHGWMSCWIIVTDQPYYAITDAEGNFVLNDIPPGNYQLNCWQEMLGEQTIAVTVETDGALTSTFTFSGRGT